MYVNMLNILNEDELSELEILIKCIERMHVIQFISLLSYIHFIFVERLLRHLSSLHINLIMK